MPYLTQIHEVEIFIMIGYGDPVRRQTIVIRLLTDKDLTPTSQRTIG